MWDWRKFEEVQRYRTPQFIWFVPRAYRVATSLIKQNLCPGRKFPDPASSIDAPYR